MVPWRAYPPAFQSLAWDANVPTGGHGNGMGSSRPPSEQGGPERRKGREGGGKEMQGKEERCAKTIKAKKKKKAWIKRKSG